MCPSYMNFLEILFVIQVIALHIFWIFYQDFWSRNTRQGKQVMRLEAEDHTGSWWPPAARPRPLASDWWAKLDLLLKQQRGTGAGWVGVPDSIPLKWWLFQGLETQVMQPNAPAVVRRRQQCHMPGHRREESTGLYAKLEVFWTFSLKPVSWDEFNEHYLNKMTLRNIYSYCIDIHLIHSWKQIHILELKTYLFWLAKKRGHSTTPIVLSNERSKNVNYTDFYGLRSLRKHV